MTFVLHLCGFSDSFLYFTYLSALYTGVSSTITPPSRQIELLKKLSHRLSLNVFKSEGAEDSCDVLSSSFVLDWSLYAEGDCESAL